MSEGRVLPVQTSTGAVTFEVLVEGQATPETFEYLVLATHKEVNRVPFARLVLRDGNAAEEDFTISNTDTLVPGKKIEIKAGYDSDNSTIFKGIIIKQAIKIKEDGISTIVVECRDESVKMTVGRKNKYFIDTKDSDAMEEIIGSYSLTASVEATSLSHQKLVQYYTTDWDFVLSRAEANGQLLLANDGEVSIKKPDYSPEAGLTLIFGDTIYEFEAEMDARCQYSEVKASSWDFANQQILEISGNTPTANTQGNITESELAGVIGLSSLELRHSGPVVQEELQSWADATLVKSHLAKIVGRAKLRGYADIKPGDMAAFRGVGERFSGKNYVTVVRQELLEGEWYTHLQFGRTPKWFYQEFETTERPASGLIPGINGLQIGVVSALEGDPDGEDRIQVKLPILDAAEDGIWVRLASLDAGQNRGFVFRPEIDDEVIVGFVNDDPRHPVVLGMLHSSSKPAPTDIPAADDNHIKGLVTRSEMKVLFDDEKSIITVETPGGNKAILDDDQGAITLEDQNGNKVVLDSNGITLESASDITLKATGDIKAEGVNIEHKAQAQFKADGSAGLELTSSAIAKLQGSLVQIN